MAVVNLELKKEVYIESLEMNGKLYLVSIMKHSSLNMYMNLLQLKIL